MSLPTVSSVLKEVDEKKTKKEKIEHLRYHRQNKVMIRLLKYVFDPKIKFALPEGTPPYKPSEFEEPSALYREDRRLYLFIEGGNPDLNPVRREMLFIEVLETVHPDDAKLLLAVKDKTLPYKSITEKLVKEAFPKLL